MKSIIDVLRQMVFVNSDIPLVSLRSRNEQIESLLKAFYIKVICVGLNKPFAEPDYPDVDALILAIPS